MNWERTDLGRVPVKSWCGHVEEAALEQAANLANHPCAVGHVALMPDCHVGYGMPIGGVVACENALIPNAVGVDIGCGMCAVQTAFPAERLTRTMIRKILGEARTHIPMGEGHAHHASQSWSRFEELPGWMDGHTRELSRRNLGTLGGGNHFIEVQAGDDGCVWLMIHSGSRNLGYRIADHHQRIAAEHHPELGDLAYLEAESEAGQRYIAEMTLAMAYALENRARMMRLFKQAVGKVLHGVEFTDEINIHHNYACREEHFGKEVWVHRKGATSARRGEPGIIPGSMGTFSFIVSGCGNPESLQSCAHGAGRTMGRMEASRTLSREACDRAMEHVVFDGWHPMRKRGRKGNALLDLSEAPQAYKDIDAVIEASSDLVEAVVRLRPLGVLKG